jgi:hypothetical protein
MKLKYFKHFNDDLVGKEEKQTEPHMGLSTPTQAHSDVDRTRGAKLEMF